MNVIKNNNNNNNNKRCRKQTGSVQAGDKDIKYQMCNISKSSFS